MKKLSTYKNGNYTVNIYNDGTKERITYQDEFIPSFAECCDVKITDKCDGGCDFCYEGCTPAGKHADILKYEFLDTIKPFTELAINGNDLTHPQLLPFLEKMKKQNVIVNMTVNQIHFMRKYDLIKNLIDENLIKGLGVSFNHENEDFLKKAKTISSNVVIHVINGVVTKKQMYLLVKFKLKVLILGYKELRRGVEYLSNNTGKIKENQKMLYDNISFLTQLLPVVSFDNLAIEQLKIKRLLSNEEWKEFYMGDDGNYTFYLDLVEGEYAMNSLCQNKHPIKDDVVEMFSFIRCNT